MSKGMNGYELTRTWYNFKFKDPKKVKASHSDMFFYIVDLWNRLGQKDEFGLPTTVTMEALGIGSYNTYKKTLNSLFDFGFIKLVSESKNQHQSKIIALSKIDKATDKALDKATAKALDKATDKATDSIIEQENKGIKEQGKEKSPLEIIKSDSVFWEQFQMKYKNQISEFDKMLELFELKVDEDKLEYDLKILKARIQRFAIHWQSNQKNNSFKNQKVTSYAGNR